MWCLVHPAYAHLVADKKQLQTVAAMEALQKELPQGAVDIKRQQHGQAVCVPPGWAHAVFNLLSCVKITWDKYEAENLPLHALARRDILIPHFHDCADAGEPMPPRAVLLAAMHTWSVQQVLTADEQ